IHATGVDTVSGLEQLIHISKSSLSLTITKMEKSGYLTKDHTEEETDGRIVHLRLTDKGKKVLNDMNNYYHQIFSEFYYSLDSKRKKNLVTGIEKLNLVFK
ncbi:MAG: winged helix DNA-binding protein, partial [Clostridiales bacterium]|nr:winged helix DNA-binding protein [Clostridiales bacterium]